MSHKYLNRAKTWKFKVECFCNVVFHSEIAITCEP